MRGIGILLVAFGHCISVMEHPINRAILSFHMPLFFFISGLLFYGKIFEGKNLWAFIKHKSFSILIPQVTCSVIGFLFNVIWYVVIDKENKVSDFINFDLLMWFLIVLYLMEIAMFVILRYKNTVLVQVSALLICLLMFYVTPLIHNAVGNILPASLSNYLWTTIEQFFGATFFGFAGLLSYTFIQKYHECVNFHGCGLLLYCIVAVLARYNDPIGMYANDYGNRIVFIIIAFLGIIATIDISFLVEKSRLFSYFGKNSIIIYVTHFTVINVILGILHRWLNWNWGEFPCFVVVFCLLIIAEIFIIWCANRYVPFLFGKKKQKKVLEQTN